MINIAKATDVERRTLFQNTAEKMNLSPGIVEKDFWVCYILEYIFNRSPWKDRFVFKGGTSLSKAYHIIERFSEDIDLILDWRLLSDGDNAWLERSRTQQDKYNKKMVSEASRFLEEEFMPKLKCDISDELGIHIDVEMDPEDREHCTVNIYYPHVLDAEYIRPEIRLEIGPMAEWTPSHEVIITSYAYEQYPKIFKDPMVRVLVTDLERIFWEKITILHKTASSYDTKGIPQRYARHYYDVYRMCKAGVHNMAFERKELYEQDVRFKLKFYYSKAASYETAKFGTTRLVPPEQAMKALKADYNQMKGMLFGNVPDFEEIIKTLRSLEIDINML